MATCDGGVAAALLEQLEPGASKPDHAAKKRDVLPVENSLSTRVAGALAWEVAAKGDLGRIDPCRTW